MLTPTAALLVNPDDDIGTLDLITGTERRDHLTGTDGDDTIDGLGGGDRLFGLAGRDLIEGGEGRDTMDGGVGRDTLIGGDGNDGLIGGAGHDLMQGGAGDDYVFANAGDTIDGGDGHDRLFLNYDEIRHGLDFDLAAGVVTFAPGKTAQVSGVEEVYGSKFGDVMHAADDGSSQLYGGKGADTLIGSAANGSLMDGGMGGDILTGGGSSSGTEYVFGQRDSTLKAPDLITDLDNFDDIDLSAIDTNRHKFGDQKFVLVEVLDGHRGEAALVYDAGADQTSLLLDIGGDGQADQVILISGDHTDFTNFVL